MGSYTKNSRGRRCKQRVAVDPSRQQEDFKAASCRVTGSPAPDPPPRTPELADLPPPPPPSPRLSPFPRTEDFDLDWVQVGERGLMDPADNIVLESLKHFYFF